MIDLKNGSLERISSNQREATTDGMVVAAADATTGWKAVSSKVVDATTEGMVVIAAVDATLWKMVESSSESCAANVFKQVRQRQVGPTVCCCCSPH